MTGEGLYKSGAHSPDSLGSSLPKASTMKVLLVVVCVFVAGALCRDAITVDVTEGGGSLTDLSGTDLARKYCVRDGNNCDAGVIEANYCGTEFQCSTRCNQRVDCLSFFYSTDRICTLQAERCTEFTPADGRYFDRCVKDADGTIVGCAAGSEPYVAPENTYSRTFCMAWGKKAQGLTPYYQNPQAIAPYMSCLEKCTKIKSCAMVDFDSVNGKCNPLLETCAEEDLLEEATSQNFIRLPEGVTACPEGRTSPSEEQPEALVLEEPADEPVEEDAKPGGKPEEDECGGHKYVTKVWGEKGQMHVTAECNEGCVMTACRCRPWGHCNGARFTSRGKCKASRRTGNNRKYDNKRIFAQIKCEPIDKARAQYVSSASPGEPLACGTGYSIRDCAFFAHRRTKYTRSKNPARGKEVGCGIERRKGGCWKTGRCKSTALCLKDGE